MFKNMGVIQEIKQVTYDNSLWKDMMSGSKSNNVKGKINACRSKSDSIMLFTAFTLAGRSPLEPGLAALECEKSSKKYAFKTFEVEFLKCPLRSRISGGS